MPIISIVFIIAGLAILALSARGFYKSKKALAWPSTPGKIVSVEIIEDKDDDGPTFQPNVRYEYAVNGRSYVSDKRWPVFKRYYRSLSQARKSIEQYSVNAPVSVFFNPKAAHDAVLEPGKWQWIPLVLGSGFVAMGAIFLWICQGGCTSGSGL